jgi:hypothetical protein
MSAFGILKFRFLTELAYKIRGKLIQQLHMYTISFHNFTSKILFNFGNLITYIDSFFLSLNEKYVCKTQNRELTLVHSSSVQYTSHFPRVYFYFVVIQSFI